MNESINQLQINDCRLTTHLQGGRWNRETWHRKTWQRGTRSNRGVRVRWLPIDFCLPRRAVMTTSTGLSIRWCCLSMIYAVFLWDAYQPLFLVVWSSAAYHDDRHYLIMIACDACRLTINALGDRIGYRPVAIPIHLFFCSLYDMPISTCSICLQKPGFASSDPPSTYSGRIHRALLTRQAISRG